MLEKKQIWVVFLFNCKMNHKAVETTHNINSAFGPGTAYEQTVHWWFKKFCKGHRSLKDEGLKGWPSEADYDQLRGSVKLIQLQIYRSCKESNLNHSTVIQHLSQTRKLKRLDKWVLHELTEKKNHHFEMLSSVQSLSHVWLFANPWTAAHQASLSIINS